MAATKKIHANYSGKLDSMVAHIQKYFENVQTKNSRQRTLHGINDFCYGYPKSFRLEFLKRLGLKNRPHVLVPKAQKTGRILDGFVNHLSKLDGECIFLLRDTSVALKKYQQKTGKGFGILVNRNFLTKNNDEQDYFTLIKLVYQSILNGDDFDQFINEYFKNAKSLIKGNKHFFDKSHQIYQYIKTHAQSKKIIFVDLGFQFTFAFFCVASIKIHSNDEFLSDVFALSVYPWLRNIFRGKYYTDTNELVLKLELEAIKTYYEDLYSKSAASLVGFAIGDSLGFPAAGINKTDLSQFIHLPIQDYRASPQHPFLSRLKKGQYTDNTTLMMITAEHIIRHKGFVVEKYQKTLSSWVENILKNRQNERWAGPTAFQAALKLMDGIDYRSSGSTTTDSCSSAYRVISLGIFYRYLYRHNTEELIKLAETCGMITHNSLLSKTGTVITALIISNLMHSDLPETAVKATLSVIQVNSNNKILIDRVVNAVKFSKTKSIEYARKYFGTGSPICQTLPLAIFCFLKYQDNFEKGILAAANSFRNDTPQEKERLKHLSWLERLQEVNGGNTDGIAGLTGTFLGAHLGTQGIPKRFLVVEDYKKLKQLGESLIQKYE